MKYLITGGCGFIGTNLALEVLKRGEDLVLFDNLFRSGSDLNLMLLRSKGNFKFYPSDIRNFNDVETCIKEEQPDVIFHLAGQVAMTTSILNPRLDFETNTLGTFNVLESVRKHNQEAIVLYSSTNKVYGDFQQLEFVEKELRYTCPDYPNGFDENISLNFHSPYGCSKGAADQYLLDYHRIYGLKTCVFRHSSMYGSNQHSTIDQGWIGWFCKQALETKYTNPKHTFTISGNGKQVRDLLHAEDVVSLYFKTAENIEKVMGEAFNIGGGINNSLSLLELFKMLEFNLEIKLNYKQIDSRVSDQLIFVANNKNIEERIAWNPKISKEEGIQRFLEWQIEKLS
jgi:CDP-paratose 2-epimerase